MRTLMALALVAVSWNALGADKQDLVEQFKMLEAEYTQCIQQQSCIQVIQADKLNSLFADPDYADALIQCERDTQCDALARSVAVKLMQTLSYYK